MPTTTTTYVDDFKINRLTKALYDGIANPSDNELYIVTDEQVDYSEITNKPTIGSATLTIQKNGTTVQTFGANATSNVTANITVPTTAADINAQETLVSGTNIKTINNNSLLGSGNLDIDSLPSQSGQSGKFLTTDGTDASWADVDALPSQSGNSGKYLTTNGTTASWNSLATVATSGSYNDLSNKLTQGTGITISNNVISTDRTVVTFVEWS